MKWQPSAASGAGIRYGRGPRGRRNPTSLNNKRADGPLAKQSTNAPPPPNISYDRYDIASIPTATVGLSLSNLAQY